MDSNSLIVHVLSSVFNIALPWGFTFGAAMVAFGSIPLITKLIHKIF